jgi:hypothetical protein
VFTRDGLPAEIAFDHDRILADYFAWKLGETGRGMLLP